MGIKVRHDGAWVETGGGSSSSSGEFDAGTVMLFRQSSAPTGWTKDSSNNDNSALRVVTGNVTTGGSDNFSSTFGTGKTTASHTLTIAQMPSHGHSTTIFQNFPGSSCAHGAITQTCEDQSSTSGNTVPAQGGGQGHSHSFSNFNIKFTDVIQATKN